MKQWILYGFVCLMITCVFGVVSFAPIAYAQDVQEEEEPIQMRPNPMERTMRGKMVSGERAHMQRGTANARSADKAQSMMPIDPLGKGTLSAEKKYDGVDGESTGSNEMVGAKGVFSGPARVSRTEQASTGGHKQDKEGTEDLETPNPLHTMTSVKSEQSSVSLWDDGGPDGGPGGPIDPVTSGLRDGQAAELCPDGVPGSR